MCALNKWGDTGIDPCMREEIKTLQKQGLKTLACCCGHGKYPKTIVVQMKSEFFPKSGYEIFSGMVIPRAKRFYKRDSDGVYYIPEMVKQ